MRVVLDTNLLISSLLSRAGVPNRIVTAWLDDKRFGLISSETQIDEIKRVSRYEKITKGLAPSEIGRLINELRADAKLVMPMTGIDASTDPDDNFLLGMAQAGAADYLVSGDKRHVLDLENWQGTHIVTAREMVGILKVG